MDNSNRDTVDRRITCARVAVMTKRGITATIGQVQTSTHNVVASFDPLLQDGQRVHISYETPSQATTAFNNAVANSIVLGWMIAYCGPPLRG